jgi:NAD(P)-dependent dehydrogenase (short-subunit alcohol dehydrogenase family)
MRSLNTPIRDWRGRAVWLVGASSGIGLALAEALHAAGARVVVSARQADLLQRFVDAHPGAMAVPLDVCDHDAVARAAQQVQQATGLDVVVYCAGYYTPMRADAFSLDAAMRHLDVNYQGALRVLAHVLPHLRAPGHISLISSVAGYRGLPLSLAYGPTKAALINLAETLYLDLADQGLGVSVINPGFVATPLTAQNEFQMPALIQPEEAAAEILRGWARGEFEIHFPKRFSRVLKLLRWLPDRWYFWLIHRSTGL